jgi:hypothetical protein
VAGGRQGVDTGDRHGRLVVELLARKAGGRSMTSDAEQQRNDIISASIAHILKHGKDKDALVKVIIETFSAPEAEAASLADQALSIHSLVLGVTTSLAKGAPASIVTKRLEDAGMGRDSAESIVLAATKALGETRSKSWKRELQIAMVCMAIGVVFTVLVKNVIFVAFCVVGGYYAAMSAWHAMQHMKAQR